MDLGLLTGEVFFDLRKAFDSVDHEMLISKLESYGLKDIELDWFRNYLTDRKQLVSFGKKSLIHALLHRVSRKGQFLALSSLCCSSTICL